MCAILVHGIEPEHGSGIDRIDLADDTCGWAVGFEGVTKITDNTISGQCGMVPVADIWKGEELMAKHVIGPGTTISYKKIKEVLHA